MFGNGIGCKCIQSFLLPPRVNSLECRRRYTSFRNEIFSLSTYLPLNLHPTTDHLLASDLFLIFLHTDRKTSLQHEFSNQTSILDLASESALQNGEAHDACGGHAKVGQVSRIRTLRDLRMLGLNWRYSDLNLRQC